MQARYILFLNCFTVFHITQMVFSGTGASEYFLKHQVMSPLTSVGECYRELTLANSGFKFFSPSVMPDWQFSSKYWGADEKKHSAKLPAHNRDVRVRINCMFWYLSAPDDSELLLRSLAVFILNRAPNAVGASIEVRQTQFPTMAEYRAGQRMDSKLVFRKRAKLP
jgi:hypothetical protein